MGSEMCIRDRGNQHPSFESDPKTCSWCGGRPHGETCFHPSHVAEGVEANICLNCIRCCSKEKCKKPTEQDFPGDLTEETEAFSICSSCNSLAHKECLQTLKAKGKQESRTICFVCMVKDVQTGTSCCAGEHCRIDEAHESIKKFGFKRNTAFKCQDCGNCAHAHICCAFYEENSRN